MLLLGLTSAKSRPQLQLIRAELSSNGSSEPPSESPSKLSSHQIPRCLRVPLQLKGCTRTSSLVSPTTPSGASVLSAFLRTQHSTSTSGSNRRVPPPRGSSSPVHLGHPLLPPLAVWPIFLYEVFPHAEGRCPRIHVLWGSAFPSCGSTASSLCLSIRVRYVYGGGRMCFPVRDGWCLQVSHWIRLRFCPAVPRSLCLLGRPDVLSWPRLRTSSSPLLHSSILSFPICSYCASMLWTDTAFGVGGRSSTGLCGLVTTHVGFSSSQQGEERARIPAEF